MSVTKTAAANVELEYAGQAGWRRRWLRKRWVLLVVFVALAAAGWWWRADLLRKARVMWWQREVGQLAAPPGAVVYEGRARQAGQLMAGTVSDYRPHGTMGAAHWWPRVWRDCPWGGVTAGAKGPPAGMTSVLFAGSLRRADGTRCPMVVGLEVKPGAFSIGTDEVTLLFMFYEPETLWRRGALRPWGAGRSIGRRMSTGEYAIYAGRVAADDPGAFEFEYVDNSVRWVVRETLGVGDSVSVTRREKK
jgi:hypothetical protein